MTYGPDMPFGGYKHSGIGRQNGDEGFEQYLETRLWLGRIRNEEADMTSASSPPHSREVRRAA